MSRIAKLPKKDSAGTRIQPCYHQVNTGFFVAMDASGSIVLMNDAILNPLGYLQEEVVGKNYIELFVPGPERETVSAGFQNLGENKAPALSEHRVMTRDGGRFLVEWHWKPIFGPEGNFLFFIGIGIDITERKKTEDTIRESEKRSQLLTEAVTDYIYTVRVESGKAGETWYGPGCKGVPGYRTSDFSHDPYLWFRMIGEEEPPAVVAQAEQILAGTESSPLEHQIIHQDGRIRWVRNTPVLRYGSHGQIVGYDGLIQDITEPKQVDEDLRQKEMQLRNAEEIGKVGNGEYDIATGKLWRSEDLFRMFGKNRRPARSLRDTSGRASPIKWRLAMHCSISSGPVIHITGNTRQWPEAMTSREQ